MIEVRNYTADDYEDFCRLNIAWIGEHWQLEPRDYEEMEQMRQGVEPGFMLVAVEAGQVVGTIAFLPMDGTVYDYELAKFAVDRNCRGKGIGRLFALRGSPESGCLGGQTADLYHHQQALLQCNPPL